MEIAERYDHRVLGRKQELWTWDTEFSPGSAFWHPHGTRIYLTLLQFFTQAIP